MNIYESVGIVLVIIVAAFAFGTLIELTVGEIKKQAEKKSKTSKNTAKEKKQSEERPNYPATLTNALTLTSVKIVSIIIFSYDDKAATYAKIAIKTDDKLYLCHLDNLVIQSNAPVELTDLYVTKTSVEIVDGKPEITLSNMNYATEIGYPGWWQLRGFLASSEEI